MRKVLLGRQLMRCRSGGCCQSAQDTLAGDVLRVTLELAILP